MSRWAIACPQCRRGLGELPPTSEPVVCDRCGLRYACADGVWDFLPSARRADFDRFLDEYTRIRLAEGRGTSDAAYYRALPDCHPRHVLAWQWRIRAASFRAFARRVLSRLDPPPLRVVDLGAGVGWLSYRLALAGHVPIAIDLSLDPEDGLGAARAYDDVLPRPFPRLRADFDALPFPDGTVDLVVFNAAFHYSRDYRATLAEALRVLRATGTIVVLDTPVYRQRASGERMVAERKARFTELYGFPSDALGSREFLTDDEIVALGRELGVRWETYQPWLGWKWALRPWIARIRGKREPSRFLTLVGKRNQRA